MKHLNYIILWLQILENTISKMSDVRVGTLERLLQISVILGRATEDVTKLPGNMTVNQTNDQYNS